MGLFSFFKKKTEVEVLQEKHKKLLEESFTLSKIDRVKSDEKLAEAEGITKQIEALINSK